MRSDLMLIGLHPQPLSPIAAAAARKRTVAARQSTLSKALLLLEAHRVAAGRLARAIVRPLVQLALKQLLAEAEMVMKRCERHMQKASEDDLYCALPQFG